MNRPRDAGGKVGQGGQGRTQGHSRPKASEMSRKFRGPGVLPGKTFGVTPLRLAQITVKNVLSNMSDVLS